jgi:molecular chaperone GrpE (heat shock protein)/DNA-binding Xre family transcriptional regulator
MLQAAGLPSQKALSQAAGVSVWQVKQLSQGKAARMRAIALHCLSQSLRVSVAELLSSFSELPIPCDGSEATVTAGDSLQSGYPQEYQRLQDQLAQQESVLRQEFQQAVLRSLESWLIQFPTLAYAAQQNPQFPAKNFLPFIRPLEQLLSEWGIDSIAPVGAEVNFDPQLHQLIEGTAQVGERVKIRYAGYRQGEKLLYRARVGRVS